METTIDSTDMPASNLTVDPASSAYLNEVAGWARFLAIVGFVFCAIIILLGLFMGTFMQAFGSHWGTPMNGMGLIMGLMYAAIAVLYFFPCYYLFNFAGQMKAAIASGNQQTLTASFGNLKSCFKFMGILTIVMLCIWGLVMIGGMGVAMFMRH